MNIRPALRSLKADWIQVVTSTGFSVAALVISYTPLGQSHPWIPWLTFVIMWSVSWAWAFVQSWNREHRKVFLLIREFVLHEMQDVANKASGTGLIFYSEDAEIDFYFERLRAASRGIDREFVKEMIAISKEHQPIVAKSKPRPRITVL
jgi:hypothetical protein